jgi:RNA polymerase sigma-70 factor (ECF subfamily)
MADLPDQTGQWLTAARAGSQEALGQALEACRGYLLLIAQRELGRELQAKGGASDLVQQTLLEACRDFARFPGASEAELLPWLRRLLLNNLADFTRHYRDTDKRRLDREVALDAGRSSGERGGGLAAPLPSPSGAAMAREQAEMIQRSLERLPEDYRRVIVLRYQEERSFEEIGGLLGLTANAARKLLLRAVERMQRELEGPPDANESGPDGP